MLKIATKPAQIALKRLVVKNLLLAIRRGKTAALPRRRAAFGIHSPFFATVAFDPARPVQSPRQAKRYCV
jgi:hypothetical protein